MALRAYDLIGTVTDLISIDEFEPKTGTNNELIVVAFYVVDEDPAKDLDSFLERSHINVIDVEVSPNPNDDGYYLVFVEMKRNDEFFPTFYSMVKDVERVTGKQNWKISPYLSDKMYNIDDDRWEKYVVIDPAKYVSKSDFDQIAKNKKTEEAIKEHFINSGLSGLTLDNNIITFQSPNYKITGKVLAFCSNKTLTEKFDIKGTPISWERTSYELKALKECLGNGWVLAYHGEDILISNNFNDKVMRISV